MKLFKPLCQKSVLSGHTGDDSSPLMGTSPDAITGAITVV